MLGVLHRRAAGRRDVPARLDDQGPGAGDRRRARLRGRGQARLARHLLHPRRRHPRLPGPAAGQPARPGRRRGHRRRQVGEHDGTYGFTVGQRKGLGVAVGDQRPRYVLGHRAGDAGRSRSGPRTWPASARCTPGARPGPAPSRRCRSRRRCSCARTARPSPCEVTRRRRRRPADHARRGAAGGRPGAVRRAVRAGRRAGRPGARAGGRGRTVDARRRRAADAEVPAGSGLVSADVASPRILSPEQTS